MLSSPLAGGDVRVGHGLGSTAHWHYFLDKAYNGTSKRVCTQAYEMTAATLRGLPTYVLSEGS